MGAVPSMEGGTWRSWMCLRTEVGDDQWRLGFGWASCGIEKGNELERRWA
jgi:hypothetical protein